jgi:hypothetical protein
VGYCGSNEASFLSARAGRWLLEFARDSGTRLVVPGDVRQHHSVERGDGWGDGTDGRNLLRGDYEDFPPANSTVTERGSDLSQGKIEEGLDKLEKFAICQVEDKTERRPR